MARTPETIKYTSKNLIKKFLIKRFQKKLLSLVESTQAKRVLDIGCGEGYLLCFLDTHIKNWQLDAIDINEEALCKAKEKVLSANLSVQDIYNCSYPDGVFDLVICSEVLEHLKNPERVLKEINRLTKRWAILSVPHEPFFALSNFLAGKDILRLGNNRGHCNRWTARSFVNLVGKYFEVCSFVNPFPWTIIVCRNDKNDT